MREELDDQWEGHRYGTEELDPFRIYLSDIRKHRVLSREEEQEVAEGWYHHKDPDAADKLVASNLRLVVKIALHYRSAYLNILDLIQEGNEGLVRALEKYDPCKGTRFSTYASFWIRACILKHLMDSWSMVKIGTTQNQRKLFYRLQREKKKLQFAGVFATPELIASTVGVSVRDVEDMEKRLGYPDVSLDSPVYEGGEEIVLDTIMGDENIEDTILDREKSEMLERKIAEFRKTLNEKELFVFDGRLMTEEPVTLQNIGERLGISRERVRQLECRMLDRFRHGFAKEFRDG